VSYLAVNGSRLYLATPQAVSYGDPCRHTKSENRDTAKAMKKRKTQQPHRNVIHLRLDEPLRARLQQEADRHRFPLVREIRYRLEDSLDSVAEREDKRGFRDIRLDMEICWHRFSARFLRMELADQLADAVVKEDPPDRIKALARLLIEHRATEQRASSLGDAL
jgi:hypothetical protein